LKRVLVTMFAVMIAASACSKDKDAAPDAAVLVAASASAVPAASVAVEAGTAGGATAAAGASGASSAAGTYAGKATVKSASMYIPAEKDWANVKFKNDESKHTGDSELTLSIDADGRVIGSAEGGAIGNGVIDGTSDGKEVRGTLRRKDPADEGLMGTFLGTLAGGKIDGTMRLSDANAAAVREATFSVAKK